MKNKTVVILGSSRSDGNTKRAVDRFLQQFDADLIDLNTKNIGYYDYAYLNQEDDFLSTIREIVANYDTIVFATPVYWYTMSAVMKTFFDRLSDCMRIEKDTGRKLRGMNMAVISCGHDDDLPPSFHEPFRLSALYLSMHYLHDVHTWFNDEEDPKPVLDQIDAFAAELKEKLKVL